jgi:hypothetical protein
LVKRTSKEVCNFTKQGIKQDSTLGESNFGDVDEIIRFPIKNVMISKRDLQELAARYTLKEISVRLTISTQQIQRKCKDFGIVVLRGSFKPNPDEENIEFSGKRFNMKQVRSLIGARIQGELIGKIAADNQIEYIGLFNFFREHGVRPVKLSIQDIQEYIHHVKPGWTLISEEYGSNKEKIRLRCDQNHEFNMLPMNLLKNQDCGSCYKNHVGLSMEKIDARLEKDHPGAKILSLDKIGQKTMVKIRCEKGHIFVASSSNLLNRKSWCATCYKENHWNTDKIQAWISSHHPGGKLLSQNFKNYHDKITIQCENGHVTDLIVGNIVSKDSWCKICQRLSIDDFKAFLEQERPGSVVFDTVLHGTNSRVTIKCPANHVFKPVVRDVYYKESWCPECKISISERMTRRIFETLFTRFFPQTKFPWLLSQKGYPMHLDGFNIELNLGFESDGPQHTRFVKYFYKSMNNFEKRKSDDAHKKRLCDEHGFIVIHVPDEFKGQSRVNYIIKSCQRLKVHLPDPIPKIDSKQIQREVFNEFYKSK